jgi:asparagine synthase (glutamine-hydrolysing)
MAHSIEARLPFLDYRLAEFAFSLPDHWKMRGPWNKFILRQAMAGPPVGSRNGLADWQALAGLDMALFDWAGRHFDMPIWRLLGGSGGRDFEAVAHIPALLLDDPVDRRDLPRLFTDPGRLRDRPCGAPACVRASRRSR